MALGKGYIECDGCLQQGIGYSRAELEKQGWKWHPITGPHYEGEYFVVCDACSGAAEARAQDRRERDQRDRVPQARCSHCGAATMILAAVNVVVGTVFRRALPTSLCRDCDCYPEFLRPVVYPADAFDPPAAFA